MRYVLLVFSLVVSLAVPGRAASSAPVQYTVTFNKPVQVIGLDGVIQIFKINGAIGGVPITGEYAGDDWRVGPKVSPLTTIASGKLSCLGYQCTFTLTTLLDQPASINGPSFTMGHPVTGPVPAFASRQAWASAVAGWAADRKIDPALRDKIVSQAAGVQASGGQ
jgi:hypothetical protein